MRFLPLVLKNVFRKRTRTLLTIASIVLPLVVVCFFGTLLSALDRPDAGATRGMFRLVVRHRASLTAFLPKAHEQKVRQLPGVLATTDFSWYGGSYRDGSAATIFPRFAVDPESFLRVYDDATIVSGSTADWLADRTGALVGRNLAEKFGWKVGDRVVLKGSVFPGTHELTIRAVYELVTGNSAALFLSRKTLDERYRWFDGLLGTIWIKAAGREAAERLPAQVDALFENSPWPTKTETEKAFQNGFVSMLGNVQLLVNSLGTILVLVIVLIAANTMAMAARERVTEIAVLRTLGFSRGRILGLILGESLVIAVTGGLLGVALFALAEPWMKHALMQSPMASLAAAMALEPAILVTGFLVAVGVGLLAGIFPALRAASRPIVDGLRAH